MSPPIEFEELVRAHTPTLRRFCKRLAGPSDGDDLMQETLARAMVSFETLRDRERFLPWCRQIARNAHARRAQAVRPTEQLVETPDLRDIAADVVDHLVIEAQLGVVLAALPERSRQILTARAEGVPSAVLARRFGVSRALVDTWFARSRRQAGAQLRKIAEEGWAKDGAMGALGLVLRRVARRRPGRRVLVVAAAAAGVGLTTLLLTVPMPSAQTRLPWTTSPRASAVVATRVVGRQPLRAAGRPTAPTGTTAIAGRHASSTAPAPIASIGPVRFGDPSLIVPAAEAEPIVVGPLLPQDQVVVGANPCVIVGLYGLPCPALVEGLRIRVAPKLFGVPMGQHGTAEDTATPGG